MQQGTGVRGAGPGTRAPPGPASCARANTTAASLSVASHAGPGPLQASPTMSSTGGAATAGEALLVTEARGRPSSVSEGTDA